MIWNTNGRVKRLFVFVGLLLYQFGYAQTDIVKLSRLKDFINAGLTHVILSSDSLRKDSSKNLAEIDTAFQINTPESPFYFAAMQKFLEGKFDSVTKKFSAKVDQIDVNKYSQLNEQQAMQALYDSAFILMLQEFPFVSPPTAKDSMYATLIESRTQQPFISSANTDTIAKPIVTESPSPNYVPWYGKFGGFLFWLLVCVLISVGLFLYCLDQIRQLKLKLAESEERITEIQEKNLQVQEEILKVKDEKLEVLEEQKPVIPHHAPVTTVYAEFRNLVTEKITELYNFIDHLNHRVAGLEKEHQTSLSLVESIPVVEDPIHHEDIFYMSIPQPGYFPFNSRSLKKDALYKFILNDTKTEARYEVINDGIFIGEALRDVARFFEPACVAENEPQDEVRVVITKAQGIALFNGEKWMIQQKAVIIFI